MIWTLTLVDVLNSTIIVYSTVVCNVYTRLYNICVMVMVYYSLWLQYLT